jgi:hypothetical protein
MRFLAGCAPWHTHILHWIDAIEDASSLGISENAAEKAFDVQQGRMGQAGIVRDDGQDSLTIERAEIAESDS